MEKGNISFKKLDVSDLDLMYKWYHTDFVNRWYDKEIPDWTREELEQKYMPYIEGQKPVEAYVIRYDGLKIGYIQAYLLKDYPEYDRLVQAGEGSAGIDLFIGERDYVHKGLGSIIILEFLKTVLFADERIKKCVIGPEPKNSVAIGAYRKVGFKYVKTIQVPQEEEPEYIMELKREEVIGV